ncbi:MAG: NTP transferase domain-containing protein [Candidatus Aenigmarchaeota archaeon]|nr:NTP transferase domain-containing protein [Candidatus Aenigmarchaeota archaeon]
MKAVVLAAGKGTRMLPLTVTMSKGMIPVANKPLLRWTCSFLDFCEEIILVVNESQRDIISEFINEKKVRLVFQEQALGTGHALIQAEQLVDGKFLMIYGDDIYGEDDIKAVSEMDGIVMSSFVSDNPKAYGVLEVRDGHVISLEEKPGHPKSDLVNCGLYLLDKSVFVALRSIPLSPRGEYELTDAIKILIGEGKVKNHTIKTWIPLTYPWNILDANRHMLDKYGSSIDRSVELRPGAVIEEPVSIGAGSIIGPNCYIRKYSSIGRGCKVGQAVEIKNSIIMDNSFVSHLSYAGETIIGRNCNVGGGTIFANLRLDDKNVKMEVNGVRVDSGRRKLGAIVGDNVKFGTRVTVMPGKRIWPNLLVPACMTIEDDIKSEVPLSKYGTPRNEEEMPSQRLEKTGE